MTPELKIAINEIDTLATIWRENDEQAITQGEAAAELYAMAVRVLRRCSDLIPEPFTNPCAEPAE
jgi:hypothetical protein